MQYVAISPRYRRFVEALDDADAGKLLRSLFQHAYGKPPLPLSPRAEMLYEIMADQMDELEGKRR